MPECLPMATAITTNHLDTKPYLDCLGCGLVLRGYKGVSPQKLCTDCRRFAAFADETYCPQCRSSAVLSCTERNGFETLFCTACDGVWCRAPSSVGEMHADVLYRKHAGWAGVERRLSLSSAAHVTESEFRRTG